MVLFCSWWSRQAVCAVRGLVLMCWRPLTAVAVRAGLTLRTSIGQHLAKTLIHLRRSSSSTIHTLLVLVVLGHVIVSGPVTATWIWIPVKRAVPAWVVLLIRVVEPPIIVLLLLRMLMTPIWSSIPEVSWVLTVIVIPRCCSWVSAILVVVISPARITVVRNSAILLRRVLYLIPGISAVVTAWGVLATIVHLITRVPVTRVTWLTPMMRVRLPRVVRVLGVHHLIFRHWWVVIVALVFAAVGRGALSSQRVGSCDADVADVLWVLAICTGRGVATYDCLWTKKVNSNCTGYPFKFCP